MFVQYGYEKSFFDLELNKDKTSILTGDNGIYMINKLNIIQKGDRYKFIKIKVRTSI